MREGREVVVECLLRVCRGIIIFAYEMYILEHVKRTSSAVNEVHQYTITRTASHFKNPILNETHL